MDSNYIAEIGQQINRKWGDKNWVCRVLERMMNIILESGLMLQDYMEVIQFWMEQYNKKPRFYQIYSEMPEREWLFQKLCVCSTDIIEQIVNEHDEAVATVDHESGLVVVFVDCLEVKYSKELESKVDEELMKMDITVSTKRERGIYDGTGMGYYRVALSKPTTTAITLVSNENKMPRRNKSQVKLERYLKVIKLRENVLRASKKNKKWNQTLLAPVQIARSKKEVRIVSEKWSVKKWKQEHLKF